MPTERGDTSRERERDRPAVLLAQGVAGAQVEALQVVAARDPGLHLERPSGAVLQHVDEGDEEVLHALPQLLHVGVLVGRALVAVDGDALVDDAPLQVELLAEGLHHELLEVAREEQQAVLVGQDDHVLRAAAVGREIPHEGEERGRVLAGRRRGG